MAKLDEYLDEDIDKKYGELRRLAQATVPNFQNFGHKNCYTLENYRNGILHALESTRIEAAGNGPGDGRKGMASSIYPIVDWYAILGYPVKRILYALYEKGYEGFTRRIVDNYLYRHKARHKQERQKLMDKIEGVRQGVFQDMQDKVMSEEKKLLEEYLRRIEEIRSMMEELDLSKDMAKYTRYAKMADDLTNKCKNMHGLDEQRKAVIELSKNTRLLENKRGIDSGFSDKMLKRRADEEEKLLTYSEQDKAITNGKTIETDGVIIL